MGKHFMTRLAETEKTFNLVLAYLVREKKIAVKSKAKYKEFYRHPETQEAIRILLKRKIDITPGVMMVLLRYPLAVESRSKVSGGRYPKSLRDAKSLRELASQAWDLAAGLEAIEIMYDIAPHSKGRLFDQVKTLLPPEMSIGSEHLPAHLEVVARILSDLAEKGPPIPEVYSKLTKGSGAQPNPYVDTFVYHLTRAFRKTYRAPLFQVTAHLLNAMELPESKTYDGRKVYDIYRRLQGHARRKRRLKLV